MAKQAHPGFDKVATGIARRSGVSMDAARAILASSARKASAKAKRRNPRLKRVPMPKKNNDHDDDD